jgi:type IV pilus assembly protein PilW
MKLQNRKCSGLSLVEMLVGVAIGLFLIGGVLQIYMTAFKDRRITEGLSIIQENGRFSVEFLTRDVRMAGFSGCQRFRTANTINIVTGDDAYAYDFTTAVYGYDGDDASSFPATIPAKADTDAIVIKRGDDNDDYFVNKHNPPAASIHLTSNHDLQQGEILMIADCNQGQVGIFQMTNTNNNNTIAVVDHNTGVGTPGNCVKGLWGEGTCPKKGTTIVYGEYGPESKIMRMVSNAYYIANNASGVPSLYRIGLTTAGAVSAAQELVQGVQDMQIEYGLDTDADGVANKYVDADDVTSVQWQNGEVASVRIKLLLRSVEQSANVPQKYSYNGVTYDGVSNDLPDDRFLRREFATTIKLRNLGL